MSPLIEVHQFLPALFPRDAVGMHTLATRRVLRDSGMGGQIWAAHRDTSLALLARRYDRYPGRPSRSQRLLLYQASTGSEGVVDFLSGRREPLAVYYHNITPPELLEPFDRDAASRARLARQELHRLAQRAGLWLANSQFSADDLHALGVRDVLVLPPLTDRRSDAPDPGYLRDLRSDKRGVDLLFVGRVVPHKAHRHLIEVTALLDASGFHPRLFLVGSPGPPAYMARLQRLAAHLGLEAAVHFTGSVGRTRLEAHYRAADVFVCFSQHEGFCVPILEAMRCGVPVVAVEAAAVAETLGGAGVLLSRADPLVAAEVVSRLAADTTLREQLVARQRQRAADLDGVDQAGILREALRELAERSGAEAQTAATIMAAR